MGIYGVLEHMCLRKDIRPESQYLAYHHTIYRNSSHKMITYQTNKFCHIPHGHYNTHMLPTPRLGPSSIGLQRPRPSSTSFVMYPERRAGCKDKQIKAEAVAGEREGYHYVDIQKGTLFNEG